MTRGVVKKYRTVQPANIWPRRLVRDLAAGMVALRLANDRLHVPYAIVVIGFGNVTLQAVLPAPRKDSVFSEDFLVAPPHPAPHVGQRGASALRPVLLRSMTTNDVNLVRHGNPKPRAVLLESAVGLGKRWTKLLLFVFQIGPCHVRFHR
jgi:hypothetical protein